MFDDEPDNANIHQPAFNEVSTEQWAHFIILPYILICHGDNGDHGEDVHEGKKAANDTDVP